jgi:hypothetical protein
MQNLKRYLQDLIESKKGYAAIAKREFNHYDWTFSKLSEDEQAELIKLAILEDKDTRADLLSNLEHLMENAMERYEEQEQADGADDWKYNCGWYDGGVKRLWEAK